VFCRDLRLVHQLIRPQLRKPCCPIRDKLLRCPQSHSGNSSTLSRKEVRNHRIH
jgi:hypothetical protein